MCAHQASEDPVLRAQGITFSYKRGPKLFDDFDLSIGSGEMVALTGRSGRGKSTLLYMLGLMVRPESGQLVVQGVPTAGLKEVDRARFRATAYGFVFQDAALDATRSVVENVTEPSLYRGLDPRSIRNEAIARLEELGVDVPLDRVPGQVSGGQAQRIALARALLHDPMIVLADEPTGNLDAESSNLVLKTLRAQTERGAAVVLSTHDPGARAACDREISL